MKIKKMIKYLPIAAMTTGLALTAISVPSFLAKENATQNTFSHNLQTVTKNSANADLRASTTVIAAKTPDQLPADLPVVDKWIESVSTSGVIDHTKISAYLTLTDVPTDAVLNIITNIPNYKTGELTFGIQSSKIKDGGVVEDTPSEIFTIALALTPRITKWNMKTAGNYPASETPSSFETYFFNGGVLDDLNKMALYVDTIAPVAGATYTLIEDSWNPTPATGNLEFSVYASKYYDLNGTEATGSASTPDSIVAFNLNLLREASSIAVKATMPPNVRVDKFETYVKDNGSTVVRSKLEEFFDLTNIPNDAIFTLGTLTYSSYDANFTRNEITFNLNIDKFNQGSPVAPSTYDEEFTLILEAQHMPTNIVTKSTGDVAIEVDEVEAQLNSLKDGALVSYLQPWMTIESLPIDATVTANYVSSSDGVISFDIEPSKIYDAASEIAKPAIGAYHFSLTFSANLETKMSISPKYNVIRADKFVEEVEKLTGQDLYNFLASGYVIFNHVDATKLSVEVSLWDINTGATTIKVTVSEYFDADGNLVDKAKSETFDFALLPKYVPSSISALPASVYPDYITVDEFKQNLIADGATNTGDVYTLTDNNMPFLNKFLLIESIPESASLTLTFSTGSPSGVANFSITSSSFHDANGDLLTQPNTWSDLNLQLSADIVIIKNETELVVNQTADVVSSPEEFINIITNDDGTYNLKELSKFVNGLNTLPLNSDIVSINVQSVDADGTANYKIVISSYFDGTSLDAVAGQKAFDFAVKTNQISQPVTTPTEESFPWWWILVGVGAAALVGLVSWLSIRKHKHARINALKGDAKDAHKSDAYTSITEKSEIDLILDIEDEKRYINFLSQRFEELSNISKITDPGSKEMATTEVMAETNNVFLKYQPEYLIMVKSVPPGIIFKTYIPYSLNLILK